MLIVSATGIHLHAGSEPNFAITSAQHPQGAWVVAEYSSQQQGFYNTAAAAVRLGQGIGIKCERYEDLGNDKRYYWGTTNVYSSSDLAFSELHRELIASLPPLSEVIKR